LARRKHFNESYCAQAPTVSPIHRAANRTRACFWLANGGSLIGPGDRFFDCPIWDGLDMEQCGAMESFLLAVQPRSGAALAAKADPYICGQVYMRKASFPRGTYLARVNAFVDRSTKTRLAR